MAGGAVTIWREVSVRNMCPLLHCVANWLMVNRWFPFFFFFSHVQKIGTSKSSKRWALLIPWATDRLETYYCKPLVKVILKRKWCVSYVWKMHFHSKVEISSQSCKMEVKNVFSCYCLHLSDLHLFSTTDSAGTGQWTRPETFFVCLF